MINKQTVLQILEDRKARLTDSLIDDALEVELDILINKISNLSEEDKPVTSLKETTTMKKFMEGSNR